MDVPASRSVSSASCNSIVSDLDDNNENGIEELTITKSGRPSTAAKYRKAKRIRFYRNGDKFFSGAVIPVTPERYRSFDSIISDLTRLLIDSVNLPSGVRTIYSTEGRKISTLDELEDGQSYVCAGKGETFKKLEYSKIDSNKIQKKPKVSQSVSPQSKVVPPPDCIRPRIVTLIRNGIKPRKIVRLLLNKRNSASMEQILSSLTDAAKLDSGAVRRVYTLSGQSVTSLPQFFSSEDVFFVYGNERMSQDDFELEFEESKTIQQYKKTPGLRNCTGPKPKMPKKAMNKSYTLEENSLLSKLSRDNNILLPVPLRSKYEVGRMIGDGNFAIVRICKDKMTNEEFALKIIDKAKCKGKEDMVENEVRILRKLSHPNIMTLMAEQDTRSMLYLIVELVRGGDLFDAIMMAQKFSEPQAALMISDLASALAYLHNMNIVHRDVKPENLLVEMNGEKIRTLKLGDFGLACEVSGPLYTVCGTPTYVAPEILAETGYGLKIDVWAAGVILYILLCGFPPFVSQDNDQEKLFDCILSRQYGFPEEYWQDVSTSVKELIQNMLQPAELRFSAEDVLDHPWLQIAQRT